MTNKTLEELKREALAEAETEAAEERDRLKKILFQTNSESKINLENDDTPDDNKELDEALKIKPKKKVVPEKVTPKTKTIPEKKSTTKKKVTPKTKTVPKKKVPSKKTTTKKSSNKNEKKGKLVTAKSPIHDTMIKTPFKQKRASVIKVSFTDKEKLQDVKLKLSAVDGMVRAFPLNSCYKKVKTQMEKRLLKLEEKLKTQS